MANLSSFFSAQAVMIHMLLAFLSITYSIISDQVAFIIGTSDSRLATLHMLPNTPCGLLTSSGEAARVISTTSVACLCNHHATLRNIMLHHTTSLFGHCIDVPDMMCQSF